MTTSPPSPPDPNASRAGRLGVRSPSGGLHRSWPLAFLVAMGLLFTTHPAMIRYVGVGLVVFVVSVFALILGAYAFVSSRRSGRKGPASRSPTRVSSATTKETRVFA